MRVRAGAMGIVTLVLAGATGLGVAHADSWVTPFDGHLAFGYAKLFVKDAPGGSLAFSVGADRPLSSTLRYGVDVDFSLLGTRTVERGSLVADVDYSAIEALAMLHWQPSWHGPIGRVSGGLGVFGSRAQVSSSGAAEFQDLPISEMAPALAGEITFMSRHPAPVRVGLETGVHVGVLEHQTWTLWNARLAFHY